MASLAFVTVLTASAQPSARVDPGTIDAGTVMRGTLIEKSFRLFNDGTEPLAVEHLEFSEPGMKARVKGKIAAGESAEIVITWDTTSLSGPLEGLTTLHLNDPEHPRVLLTLTATVKGPIEFDPRPAFYMSQFKGEQTSRSITIRNNQDRPVKITRLEPKGTHFKATWSTIEPGRAFDLKVVVPKSVEAGRFRESVIVHTDDPDRPRLHVEVNVLVKSDPFVDPDVVDFGTVSIADLSAHPDRLDLLRQTFVVARRNRVMRIRSAETGTDFLSVTIDPDGSSQTFKVDVGLVPSKLRAGPIDATLTLTTDDRRKPRIMVKVKGIVTE